MVKLILASNSPRRHDLLKQVEIDYVAEPAQVEEVIEDGLSPEETVKSLAWQKANAVAQNHDSGLVLGADTMVILEGELLGKPKTPEHAAQMLAQLSGKRHYVLTGVVLIDAQSKRTLTAVEKTYVTMGVISPQEIAWYVNTKEPFDKAGSYATQGLAARFVERIEGCYNNVLGLPIYRVVQMLKEMGNE